MTRASRLAAALALTALSALTPALARAQIGTTVEFNFAGGMTIPLSDFGERNATGYNAIVGVGMTQRTSSLGFRAEGMYNEFSYNCASSTPNCNGTSRASGIIGSATYAILRPNSAQSNTLYLIGGIGYYSTRDRFQSTSYTDVGYNAGVGFRFPLSGFSAYLEARYHSVQNVGVAFAPLTFGLIF